MPAPATPPPGDDDLLDLAALLHDVDVIRSHREMTWKDVARETGVPGPKISDLINGKSTCGLVYYQRLTRWINPAARDYLLPGAAPARIPATAKVPSRFRLPAEAVA
jgi:hypothetical protein